MEQTKKRSLTESEKAVEKIIIQLRALGFVPVRPYDFIIFDPIRCTVFEKNENGYRSEIRERNIVLEWEFGPKVTFTLRQGRYYYFPNTEFELCKDEIYVWTVEYIEITEERKVYSLEEQKEIQKIGKIVFDNQAAISIMKVAAGIHDSRLA